MLGTWTHGSMLDRLLCLPIGPRASIPLAVSHHGSCIQLPLVAPNTSPAVTVASQRTTPATRLPVPVGQVSPRLKPCDGFHMQCPPRQAGEAAADLVRSPVTASLCRPDVAGLYAGDADQQRLRRE
jgi:hypothetical protein